MNQTEPIIAMSLTARQWVALLDGDKPKAAQKAIHYFDGYQEKEMINFLNDGNRGRRDWQARGYIPRFRNVTKMVVEKSGRLFVGGLPQMDVFKANEQQSDEAMTVAYNEAISRVEFHEVFSEFDQLVRLLKTGLILVQYDTANEKITLDQMHRGNCAVMIDPATKDISALIYRFSDTDCTAQFRIITKDEMIDLMEVTGHGAQRDIVETGRAENIWGIVPAVQFYDTNIPRSGFWVDGGYDLIQLNEMVNIHITDTEWLVSFQKRPTLFTNATIGTNDYDNLEESTGYSTGGLPRQYAAGSSVTTGPDKVISVDTAGVDAPFVEYKAPVVDIKQMDDVVTSWINMYARDWSVNVRNDSTGLATSGFQLVVEGLDNRELRVQRQRMMTQGLKRFYRVLRVIINTAKGTEVFSEDSDLFVNFPEEDLPVDAKEQEDLWSLRIAEGRASTISYLMETLSVSREEATQMALQFKADMAMLSDTPDDVEELEVDPVVIEPIK